MKYSLLYILLGVFGLVSALLVEHEELLNKAVFPPVVPDIPGGEPAGHKKPLGWQRPPEGAIKEYTEALNANDFWRLHVNDHIPLVYRGYIKDSPAVKLWNDEYLTEKYGDLDVLVEHKLEDRTSTSGRMRLQDFIKNYKDQDMYIVSMFPSDMMHEVRAIPSVLCGTFKKFTHESNLWVSSGGTRSVVHYDADHNLHCLIDGRKDFIMIDNNITTKTNLYFKYKDPGVGSGFSFLDPDTIDMKKFKKIAKVPWTYATLYPGDCIFIPSVYIHQVRGYGRTIAVTTLFTADVQNNFNGDDCTDEIMKKYHSMSDIDFQWTYKKGDKTIDMGYMNVDLVKSRVRDGLTDTYITKNRKFTKKQFLVFAGIFSPFARNKTKMEVIWRDVFGLKDDSVLDEDLIDKISLEQWKTFCRAVEAPHGVVTNGTEPVFVRPGERHKWEMTHPEDDDDDYLTEKEREIKMVASRDPMFDFMSDEEKIEYIRRKKEEKAKYGLHYNPHEEDGDVDELLTSIPWKFEDIPKKFQEAVRKGQIPDEFKTDFMESLTDNVKEKYSKYFKKNRIPKEILRVLVDNGERSYRKKAIHELRGGDDDEEEEEEVNEGVPFRLKDVDVSRQRTFLNYEIKISDIKEFMMLLPQEYRDNYGGEIKQGKLPKEILMELLDSSEESFEKDLEGWKKRVSPAKKDEL